MLVFLSVIACAAMFGLLIYRYDLHEKEPWPLVAIVILLGGVTGWLAGSIEDAILIGLGPKGEALAVQAAVASLTEEVLKLLAVLLVLVLFAKEFNDPLDGLIYGAFAGLGAAVEESWFYVFSTRDPGMDLVGTEAVRLLLHVFLGGLAGFGVGLARFRLPHWPLLFFWALAADLLLHFGWDFLCGIPAQVEDSMLWQRLSAIGLMLTALVLFGAAVGYGSRCSKAVHAPESSKRLLGWPFSLLVRKREE